MIAVGVDIGGTSIKFGIVETNTGEIVRESRTPTPVGVQNVIAAVAQGVRALTSNDPVLCSVGVGVPGAMDRDRKVVRYPPNLPGWEEVPVQHLLHESLPGYAVEVDNDAKVATLAEAKLGAGRGLSHFLLVTLGTGVGGGIWVEEGAFTGILRGASGGAGEFGHITIDHNGPLCACGSRGCIEAYLGNSYLSRRTEEKLAKDPTIKSRLRNTRGPSDHPITPKSIAEAMNEGDAFARSVYEEAGTLLGVALSNVATLLDLHVFIVGGGVAGAGDVLFEAALSSLKAHVLKNQRDLVEIRRAHFGSNAGIVGAALLAVEHSGS
jgi:glucokinase